MNTKPKSPDDPAPTASHCSSANSVWLIDGEDMIIAKSERRMKAIFREYHGEPIRGHKWLLIEPDQEITLTDGSDEEWTEKAGDFAVKVEQYVPCYR